MNTQLSPASPPPTNLNMLDQLITKCFGELLDTVAKNIKLGDFLKMIELRRRLAPSDADQKKFWDLLEQVRRDKLGGASTDYAPTALNDTEDCSPIEREDFQSCDDSYCS